jgi:hypothetical protein
MADLEERGKSVIVTPNDARGALGPSETSRGDTLLPMLIGGLVLIVIALLVVGAIANFW